MFSANPILSSAHFDLDIFCTGPTNTPQDLRSSFKEPTPLFVECQLKAPMHLCVVLH